ncbi:MAG: hypothetical protein ACI9OB_000092 [Nonlabens sp.]|jgi:hypothetical protein
MRRTLAAVATAALALTAIAGGEPVELPDPVDVTMFFHGDDAVQAVDEDAYAGDSSGVLEMDRTAPTDDSYETKSITNYAQGPNARCAGNGLLPVWVGYVGRGTLTGSGTVAFDVLGGTGGEVVVDVFTDVTGQACNEDYPEPVASTTVTLPAGAGTATATLDLDGINPSYYLMVQIRAADSTNGIDNPQPNPGAPVWPSRILPTDPTAQGRVVYDGTSYLSGITFSCQPDAIPTNDTTGQPEYAEADCLPF